MKRTMKVREGINSDWVNGGLVKRLINPKTTGSVNIGTSIVYMNPGDRVIPHRHDNEECYFVVQGSGTMVLEGETIRLEKNLSVYCPANAEHGQVNDGDEPLIIYASLSPAPVINTI